MNILKILFVRLRFIFVFIAVGLVVGNWNLILNVVDKFTRPSKADDGVQGEFEWYCPMHPVVVRSDDKEKCPSCGMALARRKRGEKAQLPAGVFSRLQLSPFRIRQAGLATEAIEYRPLVHEIRTVGLIELDERRMAHVSARIAGRVDELFINFTGVEVKKGDPVYKIYSPDLVTSQEAHLLAIKTLEEIRSDDAAAIARAKRLVESARERLVLWGISREQIEELEKTRTPRTHLTIHSPIGGVVVKKDIHAGHYVEVGEDPYTLADLSAVWMQAEIFEADIGLVQEGQWVEVASETYPGESFRGRIAFIQRVLDVETRTVKARVDVQNPQMKLKPGMYVTAAIRIPLGKGSEVYYGCCESCPEIRSDVPGTCPKCAMELVKKGGIDVDPGVARVATVRAIYVCDGHPEEVFDKPGQCFKGT